MKTAKMLTALALLGALTTAVQTQQAQAQTWQPTRQIKAIVPFPAGGGTDLMGRLVAKGLSDRLGQQVYVENRGGANGAIGVQAVQNADPDGYTIGVISDGPAIVNTVMYSKNPYHPLRDLVPVAMVNRFPSMIVANPGVGIKDVKGMIAYAKANPGKLNFGTVAPGSTQNLSAELFKLLTGAQATIVTYRTTPDLVTAIVRGDIDVGFDFLAAFRPSITGKQVKIIATGGEKPNEELPGVPTVKDSGYPDYLVTSWNALQARAGTPSDVIKKMNEEVNAVLKMPEIKTRMADLGMEPMLGTPEQLGARMESEIKRWGMVIDKAGIPKK